MSPTSVAITFEQIKRGSELSISEVFKMEYRLVGETGLKVSVLGMGAMTYDTVDKTLELLRCVRKYGVNFFDNAEAYGNPIRGIAEINFGKALLKNSLFLSRYYLINFHISLRYQLAQIIYQQY